MSKDVAFEYFSLPLKYFLSPFLLKILEYLQLGITRSSLYMVLNPIEFL